MSIQLQPIEKGLRAVWYVPQIDVLVLYVVARSLDGLFYVLGQEEQKIRTNPAARATDLLKQVFGLGMAGARQHPVSGG
jgi:hypothetical protein